MQDWEEQWTQPQAVSDIELAFPANGMKYAPTHEQAWEALQGLPDEEERVYRQFADRMFFGQPRVKQVLLLEGVDGETAFRHLRVVLGCYAFKHEHKIAAAAYLASRWFAATIDYEPL